MWRKSLCSWRDCQQYKGNIVRRSVTQTYQSELIKHTRPDILRPSCQDVKVLQATTEPQRPYNNIREHHSKNVFNDAKPVTVFCKSKEVPKEK
jgi:hypothetical protein